MPHSSNITEIYVQRIYCGQSLVVKWLLYKQNCFLFLNTEFAWLASSQYSSIQKDLEDRKKALPSPSFLKVFQSLIRNHILKLNYEYASNI